MPTAQDAKVAYLVNRPRFVWAEVGEKLKLKAEPYLSGT
jgi:hypothetical protein